MLQKEAIEKLPEFTKYVKRVNVQCSHRNKMQPMVEDPISGALRYTSIWTILVFAVMLNIS